jgi:hypothetical protein
LVIAYPDNYREVKHRDGDMSLPAGRQV